MREPFAHLLWSLWDCFWNPLGDEPFGERLANAHEVLHFWIWPDDKRYIRDQD
jgi:hypothetical protein